MKYLSFKIQKKKQAFSIQLIQDNTILITGNFLQFNEQRKTIIKDLGGQWEYEKKGWRCDLNKYQQIKKKLEETFVQIDGIPDFVYQVITPIRNQLVFHEQKVKYEIQYTNEDLNKTMENELDEDTISCLFQFQKQGVKFGLQNNGRILLADEMGVGKTIQSICLACCYRQAWPLLVICPSSLVYKLLTIYNITLTYQTQNILLQSYFKSINILQIVLFKYDFEDIFLNIQLPKYRRIKKYIWKEEILKWVKSLKDNQVQIIAKQAEEIYKATKVLICSYDILPKILDKVLRFKMNIVIADEAHYLKNSQAKRTIALLPFLQKIKHVILLTGTPAFARPKELFTLLSIIRPDIFKSLKQFGNRYCDPKPPKFGGGIDYSGSSNEKELYYILKKNIMIRRLKEEVLSQLPSKRRKRVHVNVDPKILSQIQEILNQTDQRNLESLFKATNKQINNESSEQEGSDKTSYFQALSLCYQLSGQAKLNELKSYIEDLLENDIKIIVFAHHLEMMNALEEFVVKDLGIKAIRIDGQVSSQERFNRVQSFQNDESVRVAVLSLSAASTGLTLTASSNIVFAEMHWTPAIMQQAEDRAHRIGQKSSVLCHYIVGEKTLDDLLYKKIEDKIAIVSNILDGEVKQLKIDEYQNLQDPLQKISFGQNDLNEDFDDIVEVQVGQNSSGQKQTYKSEEFIKKIMEQREKESQMDQQFNQIQTNQEKQQMKNNQYLTDSESEDDDDALEVLKMIALSEMKKKQVRENQNNNDNINNSNIKNSNASSNAKKSSNNNNHSDIEFLFNSQASINISSDENNKKMNESNQQKPNQINNQRQNKNETDDRSKQKKTSQLTLFQSGFKYTDETNNHSHDDGSKMKIILNDEQIKILNAQRINQQKSQQQQTQNKKNNKKTVEILEDGIIKVTHENGDVQYLSEYEDDELNNQNNNEYNENPEQKLNNKNQQFIENYDEDIEDQPKIQQNNKINTSYHLKSINQVKEQAMQSDCKDQDKMNEEKRKIRTRIEFENDQKQNGNEQDVTNTDSNKQITKKRLYKLAKQHF